MYNLLVISLLFGFVAAIDDIYCDPSLCSPANRHVGCGHSGEFAETCPADRHMVDVSEYEMRLILHTHNTVRNRIASGQEERLSPARRMATMVELISFSNL